MGQVVLQFDKEGTDSVDAGDLSHRYLWNPAAVDQLFADEQVTSPGSAGPTYWMMSDHLGSIRDVVDSNGKLRIHCDFDSFGNAIRETHYNQNGFEVTSGSEYIEEAFGFTGRMLDRETGLQNNLNRWYDPATGRWTSEDPIGFAAGDANLNRYVGNEPTGYIDPLGLVPGQGNNNAGYDVDPDLHAMQGNWLQELFKLPPDELRKLWDPLMAPNYEQQLLAQGLLGAPAPPKVSDLDKEGIPSLTQDKTKLDDKQKLKLERLARLQELGLRHKWKNLSRPELAELAALYRSFEDPHSPESLNPLKRIRAFSDREFIHFVGDKISQVRRDPDAFEYGITFNDVHDFIGSFEGITE